MNAVLTEPLRTKTTDQPKAGRFKHLPRSLLATDRSKWDALTGSIEDFKRLSDDYDNAGSIAPSDSVIASAREWVSVLSHAGISLPDAVVPSVNGFISFEWDDGLSGTVLEVNETDRAEVSICPRSQTLATIVSIDRQSD